MELIYMTLHLKQEIGDRLSKLSPLGIDERIVSLVYYELTINKTEEELLDINKISDEMILNHYLEIENFFST